jgi:uncharacterized protein YndB with AHSA1/START domain
VNKDQWGVITVEGEFARVRFEREYPAGPQLLWSLLTDPQHLRNWLAEAPQFDARVSGRVHLRWNESDEMNGVVRIFDPPHVLEYTWFEGAGESIVRFEIVAINDERSRLILEHRRVRQPHAAGIAAGWHAHLDAIDGAIREELTPYAQLRAEVDSLAPHYEDAVKRQ